MPTKKDKEKLDKGFAAPLHQTESMKQGRQTKEAKWCILEQLRNQKLQNNFMERWTAAASA